MSFSDPDDGIIDADVPNIYVAWCDVMGSSAIMERNIHIGIVRITHFHSAILRAQEASPSVEVVPAGDGAFITCMDWSEMRSFLLNFHNFMGWQSSRKIADERFDLLYLTRCAVSFGQVGLGSRILKDLPPDLSNHQQHIRHLIMGPAVAAAYQLEKEAPPFGIVLHESVMKQQPSLKDRLLRWNENAGQLVYDNFIKLYFAHQDEYARVYGYDTSRTAGYLSSAYKYFAE